MRSVWAAGVMAGVLFGLAASSHAQGNGLRDNVAPRMAQASDPLANRYDEATGLWLIGRTESDGRLVSEVKGGDLVVRKTIKAPGELTIEILAGRHAATITVSRTLVEVKTRRRTVRFDPTRAAEADYHAAKQVLAESGVVSRARAAAAGLGREAADSVQGLDFQLTDAVVGILDGDTAAVDRLKERIRTRVLGIGLKPAGGGAIGECYEQYKWEVYRAWIANEECVRDFDFWNVPMRNLCNLEWTIRVEAAWFEFVGCTVARAVKLG
jgi:hypothetical protein